MFFFFFFFNDTATTEIYTLSLHDALPIWRPRAHLPPASILKAAPGNLTSRLEYCEHPHGCVSSGSSGNAPKRTRGSPTTFPVAVLPGPQAQHVALPVHGDA